MTNDMRDKQKRFRVLWTTLNRLTPSIEVEYTDDTGFLTTKYGKHFITWKEAHEFLLKCLQQKEQATRLELSIVLERIKYAKTLSEA